LRIAEGIELAFVRGNGHLPGAQFRLRLLQALLEFILLALQRAFVPADFCHLLLQGRQAALQLGDLVLPPQKRARRLAVAEPVVVAAGVNAVGTQQLAAQGDILKLAIGFAPGGGGRIQIRHQPRRAQQSFDQRAD